MQLLGRNDSAVFFSEKYRKGAIMTITLYKAYLQVANC